MPPDIAVTLTEPVAMAVLRAEKQGIDTTRVEVQREILKRKPTGRKRQH
jgi:hypothetical protein